MSKKNNENKIKTQNIENDIININQIENLESELFENDNNVVDENKVEIEVDEIPIEIISEPENVNVAQKLIVGAPTPPMPIEVPKKTIKDLSESELRTFQRTGIMPL